jgi:hypothetical protein
LSTNCHQVRLTSGRAGRDVTVAMGPLAPMNCLKGRHLQRFSRYDSAANPIAEKRCAVQNETARMAVRNLARTGCSELTALDNPERRRMSHMTDGWL